MSLTVKKMGKAELYISVGTKRMVYFYSINPESTKKDTINHHILLVDVSGSMHGNIRTLKDKLKVCLEQLTVDGNNYVSVITYSGHGQSARIISAVKCDAVSYKMVDIYGVVDKELYTKSVTVMSEPLENSIKIVESLGGVCDNHHIALFTDGCLVPNNWSTREEENKCFQIAEICKNKDIILNAVGFGRYYDREFLKKLVEKASNGAIHHIDEIEDYSKTILDMIRVVNNTEIIEVDIKNKDFFILNGAKLFNEQSVIRNFQKNSDNIIAVFDEDLKIGTEVYPSGGRITKAVTEDMLYAVTLNHIINERIDDAEIVVAQTGDVGAYKAVNSCYSFEEKGKVMSFLSTLYDDKKERFKEGKETIKVLSPEEEPICLLEVLDNILSDKDAKLLWNLEYKYNKISQARKSEEGDLKFDYNKKGYAPVTSTSIGGEKLNINVKAEITGNVVNKSTAETCDGKIIREFSLIVNGNVNTTELWCQIPDHILIKFQEAGIIKSVSSWEDKPVVILDLTKVKATNKRMLKLMTPEEIAKGLYRIEELAVEQWAVKQQIKETVGEGDKLDFAELSEEEIERRRTFNVNEKGIYVPEKLTADDTTDFEVYPASVLEWKVEKFPKKKSQETALGSLIGEIAGLDDTASFEFLTKKLKTVQAEKKQLENKINIVRISTSLIGKSVFLWENTETKAKKVTDKVTGKNMVIGEEVTINTKNMDDINLRQDSYKLLIKVS